MSLPSAVVAQGERAEALLQAASARRQGNTDQPAPAQATATPQVPPKEQAPAATATPSPTPTPSPAPAPDDLVETLRQQNRVLQGKYNAEVPRLAAQAKAEHEARIKAEAALEEERKKLRAQPLVTAEEKKEFGEPLIELARKIAREENAALVAENGRLEADLKKLGAQVAATAQVGQSLNTQSFFSALDAAAPNWRAVNAQKEFLAWLDGVDPLYGRTRQEILDEAQNSLDAKRVGAFFTAYEADVQSRAAPRTEALESQVTPDTTGGTPPNPDAGKKIWTAGDITKFYDQVRRGQIKAEDAARIEQDIHAAQKEGRYRPR